MERMNKMPSFIIAGTIRSNVGLPKGIEILQAGGAAIDAVEQAIRLVEDNLEDWTVGSGGLPNLLGEVELDASIMDGKSLQAGAVAGIKQYKNPSSIARKVMEETVHVLLVGEGADRFAELCGFEKINLLTQSAEDMHRDFLCGKGIIVHDYDTEDTLKLKQRYFDSFKDQVKNKRLLEWYNQYAKLHHGTVNVIAKDMRGDICCGVSTSGLSFKLPGRTGDSPIIGAGNYADNRFGAAACVGVGEIAIRLSLARVAVYEMSQGNSSEEAAINAIKSIGRLGKDVGSLAILVMDANGVTASASNFEDFSFWVADSLNPAPEKKKCLYVDTLVEESGLGYHK